MIDRQGRCVITDHGASVLFNTYGPAVTNELSERFAFKMRFYQVGRLGFSSSNSSLQTEWASRKAESQPTSGLTSKMAQVVLCPISYDDCWAYKKNGCMLQVLKYRMEAMLQAGRSVVLAGNF